MFKILTDLDITFQREKTFEDLRGLENGYLRYDFAIPTSNDNRSYLLIEVDGIQHTQPVHFGDIDDDEAIRKFKILQEHDRIKNLYAVEAGYPLLRLDIKQIKDFKELTSEFSR